MTPTRELVAGDGALHALFVHGIGEQGPDFAADSAAIFRGGLAKKGVDLYHASVHWAPLADRLESDFFLVAQARGTAGRPMQRLSTMTLADALTYQANGALRERIYGLVDYQLARLRGRHVVAFAHSLGGLIMTDYLRARPNVRNVSLVTMGCNVGLFYLGRRFLDVPQLRDNVWINAFDRHDALGFPVVKPELDYVVNYAVNVGSWWARWNGLAHLGYWGDKKLWKKTMPFLLGV